MRGAVQSRTVWWAKSPYRERQSASSRGQHDASASVASERIVSGVAAPQSQRTLSQGGAQQQQQQRVDAGLLTICSRPFAVSKQSIAAKEEELQALTACVYQPEGGPWLSTMVHAPSRDSFLSFRGPDGTRLPNRNQDPGRSFGKELVPVGEGVEVVYVPECALHCNVNFIYSDKYSGGWRVSYIDEEGREVSEVQLDGEEINTLLHGMEKEDVENSPCVPRVHENRNPLLPLSSARSDDDAYDHCSSSRPKTAYARYRKIQAVLMRDAEERHFRVKHMLYYDPVHRAFGLLTSATAKRCTSFVFRVMVENLVYTRLEEENTKRAAEREEQECRRDRIQRFVQGEQVELDEREMAEALVLMEEHRAEVGALPPFSMSRSSHSTSNVLEIPSGADGVWDGVTPDISPRPVIVTVEHSRAASVHEEELDGDAVPRLSAIVSEDLAQDETTERMRLILEERKYSLIAQAQWVRYMEKVKRSHQHAIDFQEEFERMNKMQERQQTLIDEVRQHLVALQEDMVRRSTREVLPYKSASPVTTTSRADSGGTTTTGVSPISPEPPQHGGAAPVAVTTATSLTASTRGSQSHYSDSAERQQHTQPPFGELGHTDSERHSGAQEDLRELIQDEVQEGGDRRTSQVSRESCSEPMAASEKRERSISANVDHSIRSRSLSVSGAIVVQPASVLSKEDVSSRPSGRDARDLPAIVSDQDFQSYFALTSVSVTLKGIWGMAATHKEVENAVVEDIAECLDIPPACVAVVQHLTDPSLDDSIHLVIEHDGLRGDKELQDEISYCAYQRTFALVMNTDV